MPPVIEDVDLFAEAETRFLEQFKDKIYFSALVEIYTAQMTELQTVFLSLLNLAQVTVAEGVQLDGIGDIVGEARTGRTDANYRIAILARIRLNLSNGTLEDVIALIRAIAGQVGVQVKDFPPASFVARIVDVLNPDINPALLASFVASGRPTGVNGQVIYQLDEDAAMFTFASGDSEEASTDQGWADDGQTIGGEFADVEEA